ncbi:MAG: hypothetical protein C3F11_20715, partial [Methylocystaceae bacterium]
MDGHRRRSTRRRDRQRRSGIEHCRRTPCGGANHFGEPLVIFLMHLHYTLLQGTVGATLIGVVGLFLMLSLATGVYLWLPRNGRWRQAFWIKRGASIERLTLDLQKTTGVYVCGDLLVILLSGVYLTFGPQVRAIVGLLSPVGVHHIEDNLKSAPSGGRPPVGAEAVVMAVDHLLPDGTLMSLPLQLHVTAISDSLGH